MADRPDHYPPASPGGSPARGFKYLWERHTTDLGLTPAEQAVAWRLSMYADGDGRNSHPGRGRLAAVTGLSLPAVSSALTRLRKLGLAEIEEQPGGPRFGEDGRGPRAATYRLTLPHGPGTDCPLCRQDSADRWLSEPLPALGRGRRQPPNWVTETPRNDRRGAGNRETQATSNDQNWETQATGKLRQPVNLTGQNRVTQATPPDQYQTRSDPAGVGANTGGTASANDDAPRPSANDDGRAARTSAAVADEITTAHRRACRPQLLPAAVRQHAAWIANLIDGGHDPADVAAALTDWRDRHNNGERVEHGLIPKLLERREMNRAADDAAVFDPADVAVVCHDCGGAHRDTDPCPT